MAVTFVKHLAVGGGVQRTVSSNVPISDRGGESGSEDLLQRVASSNSRCALMCFRAMQPNDEDKHCCLTICTCNTDKIKTGSLQQQLVCLRTFLLCDPQEC